jgi:hypothetical protein
LQFYSYLCKPIKNNLLNTDAYTNSFTFYCCCSRSNNVLSDCFGKFAFKKHKLSHQKNSDFSDYLCQNEEENGQIYSVAMEQDYPDFLKLF